MDCIICGIKRNDPFSTASERSINNIKLFSEKWAKLGKNISVYDRIKELKVNEAKEYKYHRKCYQSHCHQKDLERAEKKYEEDLKSTVSKKRGRASQGPASSSLKTRKTYDQEFCVFCQSCSNDKLHEVCTGSMGRKFLQIKEHSKDEDIRARLSFLSEDMDAFAHNMKYHINCLRKETKNIDSLGFTRSSSSEQDAVRKAICDIEIVNIVQLVITDNVQSPAVDMNTINDTYRALLEEHNVTTQKRDYKQYLKSLLLDNIPAIDFVKRGGPKPEVVISNVSKDKLLTHLYESNVDEEMEVLSKAAQIIRREVDNTKDWQFTGSFDDFETPEKLVQLLRWITYGPHTTLKVKRETEAEQMSRNLAQHIISSYRSNRQVRYDRKKDINSGFQKSKKTPLTVGLSLTSYASNRSRSEVEMLQSIKTGVSYDEVETMTTRMATAVICDINDNSKGVHVPSFVKQGERPVFAADNIDFGGEKRLADIQGVDELI